MKMLIASVIVLFNQYFFVLAYKDRDVNFDSSVNLIFIFLYYSICCMCVCLFVYQYIYVGLYLCLVSSFVQHFVT